MLNNITHIKQLLNSSTFQDSLVKDEVRYQIQMICFPAILGLIALFMTVVNVITKTYPLTYFTLFFFLVCAICVGLMLSSSKNLDICEDLFFFGVVVLFTLFLITGGISGFSPIWICLMPSSAMFIVGMKKGSLLCLVQFIITALILDTPIGTMLGRYAYSHAFCYRFPILFVSMYLVGFMVEYVRKMTSTALLKSQEQYKKTSVTDVLTGTSNRLGFDTHLEEICSSGRQFSNVDLVMMDVDDFKAINDTYGHRIGDKVLQEFTQRILPLLPKDAFFARWEGDEFTILLAGDYPRSFIAELCSLIVLSCKKEPFVIDGQTILLSTTLGAITARGRHSIDNNLLLSAADNVLQSAKKQKLPFLISPLEEQVCLLQDGPKA